MSYLKKKNLNGIINVHITQPYHFGPEHSLLYDVRSFLPILYTPHKIPYWILLYYNSKWYFIELFFIHFLWCNLYLFIKNHISYCVAWTTQSSKSSSPRAITTYRQCGQPSFPYKYLFRYHIPIRANQKIYWYSNHQKSSIIFYSI